MEIETFIVNGESIDHYYIEEYLPMSKYVQDEFSKDVLRFKNGYGSALRKFTELMSTIISTENLEFDIIIPIPSSSEESISHGSEYLVENLSGEFGVENGTGILRRIESVPSAHRSGSNRPTEEQHYDSIICEESLSDRRILLFDDVLTTSNTARGCIRNILEKGYSEITLITLAKTAL